MLKIYEDIKQSLSDDFAMTQQSLSNHLGIFSDRINKIYMIIQSC